MSERKKPWWKGARKSTPPPTPQTFEDQLGVSQEPTGSVIGDSRPLIGETLTERTRQGVIRRGRQELGLPSEKPPDADTDTKPTRPKIKPLPSRVIGNLFGRITAKDQGVKNNK
ncbi:hypothetical protein A2686_02955 [Candidatus Woesebacteria bacterium RIFCSPHIGHO2_01_FULL_38_10]|uniref:Uncharacterized protein n=1 Tax=Candidatus Woesebacteria bacterium RIFCSPLOWO2_01_FULL_39_10b TaxID=1802517 RepID=A0A1F8B921_9BACT|nr:MAG: hypothetical protein A2686_02955 [Candidatus Woesebacteria bacterium RIFCSPHIGHO2_01_FULL_38_10]OGM60517.1 MAG: hypothetical protein A2892_00645 [Candidatus Woesebacteria bacterium RIFCSPLOWO2_01_FULL_39_10b]